MRTEWLVAAAAAAAGLAGLDACAPVPEVTGRALYQDYCVRCHGASGQGDGPAAAGLAHRPADLTRIGARAGGAFPMVRVMSVIDGYSRRGDRASVMPELGAALQEGPLVLVETAPGVNTPTPANLVALAEYLRGLQR